MKRFKTIFTLILLATVFMAINPPKAHARGGKGLGKLIGVVIRGGGKLVGKGFNAIKRVFIKGSNKGNRGNGTAVMPGMAIGLVYDPAGKGFSSFGLYIGGCLPIPIFGYGGIYGTGGIILGGSKGFSFAVGGGLMLGFIGLGILVPTPVWIGLLALFSFLLMGLMFNHKRANQQTEDSFIN